jgi:hypothetical protein
MKDAKPEYSLQEAAEAGSEADGSQETYSQQVESARELVKRWAETGPILEELRLLQLQELDDETARKMMLYLFSMWRPRAFDDLGAGLVEQKRIFAKLREHDRDRSPGQ